MDVADRFRRAQEVAENISREIEADCVFQLGSSLRDEDFTGRSDLNLIAVSDSGSGRLFRSERRKGVEVKIVNESKEEFLELVKRGSPMELLAWECGKTVKGEGFREDENLNAEPTDNTAELLGHNALNSYENLIEVSLRGLDFWDEVYYSYRDLSRALIVIEEGDITGRDREVREALQRIDRGLAETFWRIRDLRHAGEEKRSEKFRERRIEEIENLAGAMCRKIGLDFLSREEIKDRLEERGYGFQGLQADLKAEKMLVSGERNGGVSLFVWDMKRRKLVEYC